jgi:hypothetical protein
MTRKRAGPPSAEDFAAAYAAADRYRAHFGVAPNVWSNIGRPRELARELDAAVARGEPLTAEELRRRLGFAPLPPGAIE